MQKRMRPQMGPQMGPQMRPQIHVVYLDGETSIFTFDCAYEKQDTRLINVIALLCELSDTDTYYNMVYYISNKSRFDKITNIPIQTLMNFIDEYSADYQNIVIEEFKTKIQQNYGYIPVLQILYSQKTDDEWDKICLLI